MKRSQVVDIIASWAKPEILQDVYANNYHEWADNLLYTLETEANMLHCEKRNLGEMGNLWTIKGWEDET